MRTLVIGDIHGCSEELRDLVDRVAPTRVVCVGDLYTKGPDPGGVWRWLRTSGAESVLGNHDERLLRSAAGEIPDDAAAARCRVLLDAEDPAWLPWLRALPLFLEVGAFTVVHASLHPSGALDRTSRDMALSWRRWPDDRADAPSWHRVYTGERRVIFGHDARGGLVRVERDGQPWVIGLDSGCVYGGYLSGYILEEDHIEQVRARRAYKPVGR
jgi:hypothetical protein